MHSFRLILAAEALLVLTTPVWAASQRDYDDCHQMADLDRRIAGCTRIINDRKEPARNRAIAYTNRCGGWLVKNDYDRAISDCDQAIQVDSKYYLAYHNRGVVWHGKGDRDRAIADYSRAIELNPKSFLSYYMRGVAWGDKGDNDRAIVDFDVAIKLDPKSAKAYFDRGKAWSSKKDYDRAVSDITRAIELRGKSTFEDYIARSIVYRLSGNASAALDDVRRAGEADPDKRRMEFFYQMGWNLYLLGRYDEAIEALTSGIADKPNYYWAYFRRGVSYDKKGDRAKALEDLQKAAANIEAQYWNDEAKAVFAQYGLQSPTGVPIDAQGLAGTYDLYRLRQFRLKGELPAPTNNMVIIATNGDTFQVHSSSEAVKPENVWEGTGTLRGNHGYYEWKFRDGKTGRTDFVLTADNDLIGYVQISDPARQASFNWWYLGKRRP